MVNHVRTLDASGSDFVTPVGVVVEAKHGSPQPGRALTRRANRWICRQPPGMDLISAFKSADYKCDLNKSAPTVGQTPIAKVDQTKQFLIFSTKPLCEKERRTQAANGD